ncbi:Os09g0482860, partial [Oryza sativa Japonica Group]
QPDRSVMFLCFGSIADACEQSDQQLKEIAAGLDKSGHRFLWVVRATSTQHLDALLPEVFFARTSGRGLVVNSWVPQPSILRHRATAAFVTHCGWNSVLEGITAGVPMLCWPLYAEQRMNKVLMVEDMGVGVEMEGWLEGLVTAEEVETKVRLVMESEHGRKVRERVEAHRDGVAMAWKDGGSSRVAFARLMSELLNV